MSPAHRPPQFHLVLAGILAVVFMVQTFSASAQKSPVFDEPPHIASGLSYIETGVFHGNLQHPPLLKEMSAAFLAMAGIHWPKTPQAVSLIRGGPAADKLEWPIGIGIIRDNPDRVMFWARLPFILLATLLGLLIYWWGRELIGSTAALGAMFLYVMDPTIIAHSALVTTDTGVTAFLFLFLFTLWRYIQRPDGRRLALCGFALGAVLGAKFSAVFALPVAVVLLAASVWWPEDVAEPAVPASRDEKVGPNSLCPCGSGKKYKKCHGAAGAGKAAGVERNVFQQKLLARGGGFLAMCGIAVLVIWGLYLFNNPWLYITGLQKVNGDHLAGYQAYFHGELARRFYSYFVAAWLLKEPLATVILALGGLVLLLRSTSTTVLKKWFLLLPPVVFVLAPTFLADDMGFRYVIPALPFGYLLGGLALATLFERPMWGRYAAAALCLWAAIAAVGIYPDHLSYFNETACLLDSPSLTGWDGGTRCGNQWLDDSNVDWGQGLKQLKTWLDRHAAGRPVHLTYFGIFPPEGYNLQVDKVDAGELINRPPPGLYVVSSHIVSRVEAMGATLVQGGGSWLRTTKPTAIVGHALYIYDLH